MAAKLEVKPRTETRLAAAPAETAAGKRVDAQGLPISADMLDGGEIVLLAIKPSPWFVLFDSARWLLFGAVLLVAATLPSLHIAGLSRQACTQLGCVLMLARVGVAFLRWVSRFYVLTNRRVMRVRGVFKADILACPLMKIQNTRAAAELHERMTGLGTIFFEARDLADADLNWYEIAKCDEVHARVRRAIERANDCQPHG